MVHQRNNDIDAKEFIMQVVRTQMNDEIDEFKN
jgi:hypothetical protein